MGTAGAHTQSPNMILRPIESILRWTAGPVTYNIVTMDNPAELTRFNNMLPAGNQAMNMDLQPVWAMEFAQAFLVIEEVISIDLQLNNDIEADFLIGQDNSSSLGYSSLPGNTAMGQNLVQGYNLTDPSGTTNAETGGGSDRFHTVIHEMGHSLGLAHPHDADAEDGTTSTGVADDMQLAPYQQHQTVMSYTQAPNVPDPGEAGAHQYGYAVSLMALDIAALQNMYGANMTTRTGNSTYTLTDAGTTALVNTGNAISIGRAYYSIWDAGTNDTDTIQYGGMSRVLINLNAATLSNTPPADVTAVTAELQASTAWASLSAESQGEITNNAGTAAGFFSSILDGAGNRVPGGFSIANGVVIENATGGTGNDIVVGNAANNTLIGNNGNDALFGGNGNDQLETGAGTDTANGGAGNDTIIIETGLDTVDGGADTDAADFSRYTTAIWVDLSYTGATGREAWTRGGTTVTTGAWQAIADLTNIENVTGSAFDDFFYGDAGNNGFSGGAGADRFFIEAGLDTVDGGAATDTADFSQYATAIWVDLSYTGATGREAWTRGGTTVTTGTWQAIADLTSVEAIVGSAFDDEFYGDAGNNSFSGENGADRFFFEAGFDTASGGAGTDNADFSRFTTAVWVDLSYAGATGFEAWTRGGTTVTTGAWQSIGDLTAIEDLTGSAFSDALYGDAAANEFRALAGNDLMVGEAGNDTFIHTGGFDTVNGGANTDTSDFSGYATAVWVDLSYTGATGFEAWTRGGATVTAGAWQSIADLTSVENLTGSAFSDALYGDAEANEFRALAGNDLMVGEAGNDRFVLQNGFDTVNGGADTDTADFSTYATAVWVDLAYTGATGFEAWTRGGTTVTTGTWQSIADLTSVENLVGSAFHDYLVGDGMANTATGGNGNDTFSFKTGFGNDTITDFQDTGSGFEDVLDFSNNTLVNSFANITNIAVAGGNTTVTTTDGTITLLGVTAGVAMDDFTF